MASMTPGINNKIMFFLIVAGLSVLFIFLTQGFWAIWIGYADTELYNYLWITPAIWLLIYYLVSEGKFGLNDKYSASISIILLSIGIYLYTHAPYSPLIDQELIAGTVFTGSALLVFLLDNFNPRKLLIVTLAVIATGILLIPPPTGWVFDLSAVLTRLLLHLAIPLARLLGTQLSYTEKTGSLLVVVSSPNGPVSYDIAAVCSGIIGFLSVLAVTPLIFYASFMGSKSNMRKLIAGLSGFLSLAIGMFLVNVLRLALVFYTTWLWGREVGYNLFHYTPEVILILPVAYIAVKIVEKIAGGYFFNVSKPRVTFRVDLSRLIAFTLMLLVITPITISYNYSTSNYLFVNIDNGPPMILDRGRGVVEEFISPSNTMGLNFKYFGRIHEWEKELNPTTRIHFFRHVFNNSRMLDIYVEYSMTGSGIHVWEVCLPWQNISIYNTSWPIFHDPSNKFLQEVWYIQYGKGSFNGVLIYWRDKVYTSRGVEYFRLTVMLNKYNGNITEKDKTLVYKLAYNLWLTTLKTSYSIRSIESIGYTYFINTTLPVIVISYIILFYNELTRKIKKSLISSVKNN